MKPLAQFSIDWRVMAGGAFCNGAEGAGQGKSFDARVAPCPWLPRVAGPLTPAVTRSLAGERGPVYYACCLGYAQSLWREGKPAQAILQLNKAWLADLAGDEAVMVAHPPPYRALVWMLRNAAPGHFLGNPVRHFQHLATRMSGPRAVARAWRAWACFHLAGRVLPAEAYPRDEKQVAEEGLEIPGWETTLDGVDRHGWTGELAELLRVAAGLETEDGRLESTAAQSSFAKDVDGD